jgi:hypothetical protein
MMTVLSSVPAADFWEAKGISLHAEELPPPELRHLSRIAAVLQDASPFSRDRIAEQAMVPNYLRRLLDIFHVGSISKMSQLQSDGCMCMRRHIDSWWSLLVLSVHSSKVSTVCSPGESDCLFVMPTFVCFPYDCII